MNTGESVLNPELTAAVLAGGRSRRMGCDKALLLLQGRPLIERIALLARRLTDQVYICTNDVQAYRFLPFPVVCDLFPGRGPLSGLHSAMTLTDRPLVLLLACDLPALEQDFLAAVVAAAEGWDAVIPRSADGRIHPLAGVYRRTLLPVVESNLGAGIHAVRSLLSSSTVRVKWFDPEGSGYRDDQLENVNTVRDWEKRTSAGL